MTNLTCVIIEDEKDSADLLQDILTTKFSNVKVLAIKDNPEDGYKSIITNRPDIVFLDIKLGHEIGFSLLDRFKAIFFEIVFTSAYSEYAVQAFDYTSPFFLTKPIQILKLARIIIEIESKVSGNIFRELGSSYRRTDRPSKLAFASANSTELIDFEAIEFLSADGSYTTLHLSDGSKRVSSKILGHYEKSLDASVFCRIHRKYLVNLDHIVKYNRSKSIVLFLTSGNKLQASNVYKSKLLDKLKGRASF